MPHNGSNVAFLSTHATDVGKRLRQPDVARCITRAERAAQARFATEETDVPCVMGDRCLAYRTVNEVGVPVNKPLCAMQSAAARLLRQQPQPGKCIICTFAAVISVPKTDAPEIWQPADDYPPEAAFVIRTGACVGIVVPFMFSAKVADGKLMLHEGAHFCAGAPVPVPAVIPTLAERGVIVQVGTRTLVAFDLKNRHKKLGVLHISPASPDAS